MKPESIENKVVIFSVGRQEYAVPIRVVKEVVPWSQPTPVPEAPPMVEGVVSLRGAIIPVIDLGRRFGTGRVKAAAESRIMIMEVNDRLAGFVVDEVTEVFPVNPAALTPASSLLRQNQDDPVVVGILKVSDQRLVVVVDPALVVDLSITAR